METPVALAFELDERMSVGVGVVLRLLAAVFTFVGELISTVAEFAESVGNPEVSTPVALIVVGLFCSGHRAKSLFVFLTLTLCDLIVKELSVVKEAPSFE